MCCARSSRVVAANAAGSYSPTDVAREARNIYGDDGEFESAFADLALPAAGARKKLLRYLLAELEKDASKRATTCRSSAA